MKYLFTTLFFILFFTSCERGIFIPNGDCTYCYQIEPKEGYLIIDLTINNENDSVIVTTYHGNIEVNDVLSVDTVSTSEFEINVPIDEYYAVTAKYKVGNKTILAVDGDKISTHIDYDCDVDCYRMDIPD